MRRTLLLSLALVPTLLWGCATAQVVRTAAAPAVPPTMKRIAIVAPPVKLHRGITPASDDTLEARTRYGREQFVWAMNRDAEDLGVPFRFVSASSTENTKGADGLLTLSDFDFDAPADASPSGKPGTSGFVRQLVYTVRGELRDASGKKLGTLDYKLTREPGTAMVWAEFSKNFQKGVGGIEVSNRLVSAALLDAETNQESAISEEVLVLARPLVKDLASGE